MSIPGRFAAEDERPVLITWLRANKGDQCLVVHRLDAEVSGLILFAKNPAAHKAANAWFESRSVKKYYQAFTSKPAHSIPLNESLRWSSKMVRGKKRTFVADHGKESVTIARLHHVEGERHDWRLEPLTGRTHQLRVHLATNAAPIMGDRLYGSQHPFPEGIALKSIRLLFNEERERFDLPEELSVNLMPNACVKVP